MFVQHFGCKRKNLVSSLVDHANYTASYIVPEAQKSRPFDDKKVDLVQKRFEVGIRMTVSASAEDLKKRLLHGALVVQITCTYLAVLKLLV